jgi:small subunit ribosomal protein S17
MTEKIATTEKIIKKTKTGTVTSNKMEKTVVVMVTRKVQHPIYKKFITKRKKFVAHDEKNACAIGDVVTIVESRPLSRTKRWTVASIVKSAEGKAA